MGGAWLSLARRGASTLQRFNASAPGDRALQMRSLALSTVGEFEKERTRLGPKSDFFFGVRNWMCGVRACENHRLYMVRTGRLLGPDPDRGPPVSDLCSRGKE